MTTVLDGAGMSPVRQAVRSIAVGEARSFARDLGGSLAHVVVAATGRALDRRSGLAGGSVGLATVTDTGLVASPVRNAGTAPLPAIRDEVDRVVAATRAGSGGEHPAGLSAVVCVDPGIEGADEVAARCHAPLLVTAVCDADDPTMLRLAVTLEEAGPGTAADAEEILGAITRLLEHPYRRLL